MRLPHWDSNPCRRIFVGGKFTPDLGGWISDRPESRIIHPGTRCFVPKDRQLTFRNPWGWDTCPGFPRRFFKTCAPTLKSSKRGSDPGFQAYGS